VVVKVVVEAAVKTTTNYKRCCFVKYSRGCVAIELPTIQAAVSQSIEAASRENCQSFKLLLRKVCRRRRERTIYCRNLLFCKV
jgi:hypothetical protein